jgi:hypothetical protein
VLLLSLMENTHDGSPKCRCSTQGFYLLCPGTMGVTAAGCGRPFENDQTNREKTNMASHLNIGAIIYPEMDRLYGAF